MSARRMPCKRCHHPRPVGTDGYCAGCAEVLRRLKLPKSVPPAAGGEGTVAGDPNELPPGTIVAIDSPKITLPDGANKMDAPDGPRCVCGKPSVFENGSCSDCAVEGAALVRDSPPAMAGGLMAPGDPDLAGVAGGETDPITERSSKVPTLPPAGAPTEGSPPPIPGFVAATVDSETVTYVAKNGDPDLAVLVSPPAAPSPLLENATVSVTAVQVEPAATLGPEKPPVDLGLFTQYTADDENEGGEDEAPLP